MVGNLKYYIDYLIFLNVNFDFSPLLAVVVASFLSIIWIFLLTTPATHIDQYFYGVLVFAASAVFHLIGFIIF